jgi:glucosamine--fructose-6-phosphate aminotransferase (isomerizing)
MCGIIGYSGQRNALPILLDGLKRLEYRGYDSAGVAIVGSGLQVVKDKGFIANLESQLPAMKGTTGLAHTRWATHGAPSKVNAHPHTDCTGKLALAHNGIIENFASLREKLESEGHVFKTETDTESLVHLIESLYRGDLEDAVRKALHEVRGSYAIAVVHADEPEKVVGARNESPLVVGLAPDENFLSSDVAGLLKYTDKVVYVMDKEMVILTPERAVVRDLEGNEVHREPQRITWTLEDAEKGGFEHFMIKEIHETPKAIQETLLGRLANLEVDGFLAEDFTSVKLVACGTSYHAALVGKYIFEEIAHIPASAELASEYRYTQGAAERPLVLLISQSGETADTLGATREAKRRGCKTLGICNVIGSSLSREADKTIYTRAGVEIGVAATKTFVAQLIVLYLVALRMGLDRGTLGYEEADRLKDELRSLPRAVLAVLNKEAEIEGLAAAYGTDARDAYYLGRHVNYPVAMEGALKLKEISYIHAEAYAAGELKHGPLALITKDTPVIAIAVDDPTYEKMRSNIGEVNARGARILGIGTEGDREIPKFVDDVITVPRMSWIFSPVPVSVALMLFAYHVARLRGCPIDKPRNLAKSVTVE